MLPSRNVIHWLGDIVLHVTSLVAAVSFTWSMGEETVSIPCSVGIHFAVCLDRSRAKRCPWIAILHVRPTLTSTIRVPWTPRLARWFLDLKGATLSRWSRTLGKLGGRDLLTGPHGLMHAVETQRYDPHTGQTSMSSTRKLLGCI